MGTPDFEFVTSFLKSTGRTQIGWHYFIDLAWIYSRAKDWPTSYHILDAGGGSGPTQFLLAELGFDVTNLDLVLSEPAPRIQKSYRVRYKSSNSYQKTTYVDHLAENSSKNRILKKLRRVVYDSSIHQYWSALNYRKIHDRWRKVNGIVADIGNLVWMRANLCDVPEIASNSFDAVVSLSAIEHIPLDSLPRAWAEINRICKPDAKIAITTSATEQTTTWFHHPSQGYCFSETDLQLIFGAQPSQTDLKASEMIDKYRSCRFLKDNLAGFYRKSGANGMPWGKWHPVYFPVGLKTQTIETHDS